MNLKNIKKVHFIGIGGSGVSALCRWFLLAGRSLGEGGYFGNQISGSDVADSEIISELKKLGAKIFIGHRESNLDDAADLAVYSSAIPEDNPELKKADRLKIKALSYPETLGEIMNNYSESIAVSGTHGKTTTTAVLGLILEKAGFNPTVIVGSVVREWDANARIGKSDYFLSEACEYRRAMLNLNPKMIVLTNIEKDHLDYFRNLEDIKSAFREYVGKLPADGLLVFNQDDPVSNELAKHHQGKKISYTLNKRLTMSFDETSPSYIQTSELRAENIIQLAGKQLFDLVWRGENLGQFQIFIPGIFNISNCLAASALALELGVAPEIIKKALADFRGVWRRFEKVGEINGAVIISDYAHHPTAAREIIKAAKQFYPGKKILAVFQPHQEDRTKKLFDEFVQSFNSADAVIMSEIYFVAGRTEKQKMISSFDLVEAIKKTGYSPIFYAKNLEETKKMIIAKLKNFDIILIMGAGDIFKVSLELSKSQ